MKLSPFLLLGCVLGLAASSAPAQVYTWIGSGGTATSPASGSDWKTTGAASWLGGAAPSSTGTATELDFGNSGTASYSSQYNITGFQVNKLVFSSTSTGTITVAGVTASYPNLTIVGTGAQIVQNGSGGVILGGLALNADMAVTGTGTGAIQFGAISTGSNVFTFGGNGAYLLNSTSGLTGSFVLASGTIQTAPTSGASAFASGSTLALNGGAVTSNSGTAARTVAATLTLGGNSTIGDATNTGTITFTGAATTTAASTVSNVGGAAFAGGVSTGSNAVSFNPISTGAVTVTGATVGSGSLSFGGSGTGTATLAGTVSLGSGGIVANRGSGAGTTTISAAVGLTSASSISNTGATTLTVTGAITDNNYALNFVNSGTGNIADGIAETIGSGGWTTTGSSTGAISLTGVLSGTGGITVNNSNGAVSVFGQGTSTSTFSGGVTVNGGVVQIAGSSTGNAGAVTAGPLGTGTITMNGGQLSSSTAGTRTLNNDIVIGSGDSVLFGSATNTGALTLGGTLTTGSGAKLGAVSTTTFNGALVLNGPLELAANTTVLTLPALDASQGLTVDFALGSGAPTIVKISGLLSDTANTLLGFNFTGGAAGTNYTVLNYASTSLTLADLPTAVAGYSGITWTIGTTGLQFQFAAVPEPSTVALLAAGLLAAAWGARRRLAAA